ncbi:MAG: non-ribosomal peptide synthetase, partial [Acidobacteria bacterium]|nr:non-ribosomal peptide synthetase [Acidobacteriota bacterium]
NDQCPMTNDYFYNPLNLTNDQCPMTNDRFYKTGDLGRWLPDGGGIEFLGRIDHQVKIMGCRIEPAEIENYLHQHPAIQEVIVHIQKREDGESYLCAYFNSTDELHDTDLRMYLSAFLPGYMIPSFFIRLTEMPLNAAGKIDRNKLPTPAPPYPNEYEPPTTELEKQIANAWKEVLKLEKVGVHDNFFTLGGNSLNVIILNNKLKQLLKRDIPPASMFQYLTIHSFVNYLTHEEEKQAGFLVETDRKEIQAKSKLRKAAQTARRKGERNHAGSGT